MTLKGFFCRAWILLPFLMATNAQASETTSLGIVSLSFCLKLLMTDNRRLD
jgi:hypothetical protein